MVGTNEKNKIVELVEKKQKSQISDVMNQTEFLDFGSITHAEKTRAAIKIQDGCNQFCTYCIIPYARGRVRSRKMESIIQEVQGLTKMGIKEIVLTGIHIASYGKDLKSVSLDKLLFELNNIKGLERIRLGSLEPTIITEQFLENLKAIDKLCHHFHLSLQSGCNETLKRMNRKYSTEEFIEVTARLRKTFPDVMLTTDIIVGFPGETQIEFETTYEFLKKIKFYKMHIFPYSQRKGTKAAQMTNQIDNKIKEARSKKLIELSNKNEISYLENYIGKKMEVLFEQSDELWTKGHTSNYLEVKIPKNEAMENEIKLVEIIQREGTELIGDV